MSRHICREEGANAQDDGGYGENDRNAIAVRQIVNADSGCLAYPSANAGYREDCADIAICDFIVRLHALRDGLPRLPKGGELHYKRGRSRPKVEPL